MKSLAGCRVVVTRAAEQADTTAELVASVGALPIVVPLIEIVDEPDEINRLRALDLDAVRFASGSAARAWADVFGHSTPPVTVAIGDQTAAAAEEVGLKITVVSADHSIYGMLVALDRYLREGN